MTIEIVELPIQNGDVTYFFVNVYQRVIPIGRNPGRLAGKGHERVKAGLLLQMLGGVAARQKT